MRDALTDRLINLWCCLVYPPIGVHKDEGATPTEALARAVLAVMEAG